MHKLFYIGIFLLLFSGCDSDRIYEKYQDIDAFTWAYTDTLSYTVNIEDTSSKYNLYVNIRHADFYPYARMFIFIHTIFPSGKRDKQRVLLPMAEKDGRWKGECISEICDIQIMIQGNAKFPEPGNYTFVFEQNMRQDLLPGVIEMGLKVEKAANKNP